MLLLLMHYLVYTVVYIASERYNHIHAIFTETQGITLILVYSFVMRHEHDTRGVKKASL